jgi:glycosyltransferase involved in cell wall biosynthesis
MRVLQVPFTFYPDAMGGTEIYVAALAQALTERGIESIIAAPASTNGAYHHNGLHVHRFAVGHPTLQELYGDGDPTAAATFGKVMDTVSPDIVHLHAHTSAVSRLAVREAKQRRMKVVLTYHTPTVSCSRGTMMLFGEAPCDGVLHRHRCTACTTHAQGVSKGVAHLIGWVPPTVGAVIGKSTKNGGLWTALQMSHLIGLKHHAVRALFEEADRVVAVCGWIREVLRRNGVPDEKVVLSRQGLPYNGIRKAESGNKQHDHLIRLAFLGRLDPVKGIDVAIEAVRRQPSELPVQLDIYGVAQGARGVAYQQHLETLVAGDERIRFCPPVTAEQVVSVLSHYDALLVPSTWLETGPLVVLEAFAAGIPVLGSRLGGIAELVTDGVDGLLLPTNDIEAWKEAITTLVQNEAWRQQLTRGVRPPRTTAHVADDMMVLYQRLGVG